jgi:hypothetical protein
MRETVGKKKPVFVGIKEVVEDTDHTTPYNYKVTVNLGQAPLQFEISMELNNKPEVKK